jgi:hypothetical protein
MVFFNMIPSLPPAEKPKPKHRAKTLKNCTAIQTKKTAKKHRGRKIKLVPKKMRGGSNECNTDTLISEPNINIPSIIKGLDMGLSINKTIARIEKSTKN